MDFNLKGWHVVVAIITAMVLFFIVSFVSTQNTAIGYDEDIQDAHSGVQIQEQRQYDLITKLVQVVEANSKYESQTQLAIVTARQQLNTGDINGATLTINAVAEAYPELKANESYTQLMTELSISENLKAEYRKTYNTKVKDYRKFVKRWPASMFLDAAGYEVQDYQYLDFEETELPDQLFK